MQGPAKAVLAGERGDQLDFGASQVYRRRNQREASDFGG